MLLLALNIVKLFRFAAFNLNLVKRKFNLNPSPYFGVIGPNIVGNSVFIPLIFATKIS